MTLSLRQFVASALFATAMLPLAMTAQANQHGGEKHGPERERMQEHRQDIYQRAELSDDKQQALDEAHATFRDEMKDVREAHQDRMAEILTEEEQEALRNAMHEACKEYREGHGKHHHGEEQDAE